MDGGDANFPPPVSNNASPTLPSQSDGAHLHNDVTEDEGGLEEDIPGLLEELNRNLDHDSDCESDSKSEQNSLDNSPHRCLTRKGRGKQSTTPYWQVKYIAMTAFSDDPREFLLEDPKSVAKALASPDQKE